MKIESVFIFMSGMVKGIGRSEVVRVIVRSSKQGYLGLDSVLRIWAFVVGEAI